MSNSDIPEVPADNKAAPFEITAHTYKIVDGHSILLDIHVPKKLLEKGPSSAEWKKKHPVVVAVHGGWLTGGQRDFAPWYPAYIHELALKHDAILVYPDYRLLPETKMVDILSDVDDLWVWLGKDFETTLQKGYPGLQVDLDHILVTGSSAGGYIATQLVLKYYKREPQTEGEPRIKVFVPIYPMLDFRAPYWSQAYQKPAFGVQEFFPKSILDDHLDKVKEGKAPKVVTNAEIHAGGPRLFLALSLLHNGLYQKQIEEGAETAERISELHPEDIVAAGAVLPPSVFLHGIQDSAVPVEGTDKFVSLLKEKKAVEGLKEGKGVDEVLRYVRVPGDHGLDSEVFVRNTDWAREMVLFVEKHWFA